MIHLLTSLRLKFISQASRILALWSRAIASRETNILLLTSLPSDLVYLKVQYRINMSSIQRHLGVNQFMSRTKKKMKNKEITNDEKIISSRLIYSEFPSTGRRRHNVEQIRDTNEGPDISRRHPDTEIKWNIFYARSNFWASTRKLKRTRQNEKLSRLLAIYMFSVAE